MGSRKSQIDPGHESTRSGLRTLGAVLLAVGVLLLAVGAYRMFSPAWDDGPDPTKGFLEGHRSFDEVSHGMRSNFKNDAKTSFGGFAMAAVGMLCAAVGGALLKFGYMGRVARYAAGELTPVATDTINYVGENAREGIHDLAEAVASGLRDANDPTPPPPPTASEMHCPACGKTPAPGSAFCNHCGHQLA